MNLPPAERSAFRRGFAVGALLLSFSGGGVYLSSDGDGAAGDVSPASATLVSFALDRVTPDLQLVQVGKWLARTLFDRPQGPPSRCPS